MHNSHYRFQLVVYILWVWTRLWWHGSTITLSNRIVGSETILLLFIISTYLVFRQRRSLFCSVLFSLNHADLPICHFRSFFNSFHSCTLYLCMGCCELLHQPLRNESVAAPAMPWPTMADGAAVNSTDQTSVLRVHRVCAHSVDTYITFNFSLLQHFPPFSFT